MEWQHTSILATADLSEFEMIYISCNSAALFDDLEIAADKMLNRDYRKRLNQHNVIYLDMTYVNPFSNGFRELVSYISGKIVEELQAAYPSLEISNELPTTMASAAALTGSLK